MPQIKQPVFNATPIVLALIGMNVAIHLIRMVLPEQWSTVAGTLGGFSPPWFLAVVTGGDSPYDIILFLSPLTYAFLHADLLHLTINMAFLLAFGTPIERQLGRRRMLGLYIVCALCAAGATMAMYFYNYEQTIMVGASGAVSGLFGAVLRFTTRRAWVVVVIFIISNVILGYTGLPGASGEIRAIAWEAHIGGFLAGFILFPLFNGLGRQSGTGRS
ncbi:MAG: rhomboid family intramembrane serine protease [Alphaproteobacteria bacterium]|nr:rhomboid family intramembrane serine protease [Alphaproteobacteria bacterium]